MTARSNSGLDTATVEDVPLTGYRVDRFIWDGSILTFDRNLIMLRSRQTDNVDVPGHPGTSNAAEQGNHNGGVLRFWPDGKLYLFMGDQGRRGLQHRLARLHIPVWRRLARQSRIRASAPALETEIGWPACLPVSGAAGQPQ